MKKNAHPQTTEASALDSLNHTAADLFPETLPPIVPARIPTPGTRAAEALQALIHAPQNQAQYAGMGWRLAAYVQTLQDYGWGIISRSITRPGCRRPIAEYRLDRTDQRTAAALASHQTGEIDLTLAGLLAFACVCLLLGWLA
jgi:hypothetical protein